MSDKKLAEIEKVLSGLTQDWVEAQRRADVEGLRKIIATDYTFVDDFGSLHVGKDYLRQFENSCVQRSGRDAVINPGEAHIKSIAINDVKTRVFGDIAVQTLLYSDNGTVKLKTREDPYNRTFRVTNMWVKQDGQMRLTATHLTATERSRSAEKIG